MKSEERTSAGHDGIGETVVCGSSLRAVPVARTLERARRLGSALGISRVTDITRLDRIGIPVFAGIRPRAVPGSLCVSAGKGVTPDEACASAWMESIEFALAEPGASFHQVVSGTARQVLDGLARPDAIYDFCPRLYARIPLDAPMPCVQAEEILSETRCLVPAELVFLPGEPCAPARYFGSSSNGLASGNSLLEATVHGLAETIENDIRSFHLLRDTSTLVQADSLPSLARDLADRIHAAGLRLFVRFLDNAFGLPCFHASIVDPDADSLMLINGGYGCHPHRQIALVRAICEAAQSRLSVIHGGRDDLTDTEAQCYRGDVTRREAALQQVLQQVGTSERQIRYEKLADYAHRTPDLHSTLALLTEALAREGLRRICRVVFTPPGSALHVVKILVPQLEECEPDHPRVGRRLKAFWSKHSGRSGSHE